MIWEKSIHFEKEIVFLLINTLHSYKVKKERILLTVLIGQSRMSSSTISSLDFAGKQTIIYVGIVTLIAGVIGGFLIPVVFLSLKTFRQNSCAFYLTIMSIVNIGQMLTGLLSRVMTTGFGIDWSQTSLFFCKFRFFCFQICTLTSMTCICLATIDQYLATCSRRRWQQWSNIKLARRLVLLWIMIWIVHNIPFLIYFIHIQSNATGKVSCVNTNSMFVQYINYVIIPIYGKFLPICITFFFGFLAYYNVRGLAHRTLPLVRRELDKQLTVMVLTLVLFSFFSIVPYTIVYLLSIIPQFSSNPNIAPNMQFAITCTTLLVYIFFAVSVQ